MEHQYFIDLLRKEVRTAIHRNGNYVAKPDTAKNCEQYDILDKFNNILISIYKLQGRDSFEILSIVKDGDELITVPFSVTEYKNRKHVPLNRQYVVRPEAKAAYDLFTELKKHYNRFNSR